MFGLKVPVVSRNELPNIEIKCSVICWKSRVCKSKEMKQSFTTALMISGRILWSKLGWGRQVPMPWEIVDLSLPLISPNEYSSRVST